ncbi:MAG TPA: helix-turn-helix domain-containing protein [Actinomycetes bacterium]|nr:helix-turn-helix domain-containing protein [Actinomycetes bacterium]
MKQATIVGMPYADYCPIAYGTEVLGDRWTPLVIREMTVGATGFNEIHRGIPKMSRTLLAQRLRTLERQGLVTREGSSRGRSGAYRLTPAGEALSKIVWAMGNWASEWVFGDPADDECDGLSIIWRLHQFAIPTKLPDDRTVVHMMLTGPGAAEGWLDIDSREVTVCKDDPGYDVDLAVEASTPHMQQWLVGRMGFRDLTREGHARVIGPSRLARAFPSWFDTSTWTKSMARGKARALV